MVSQFILEEIDFKMSLTSWLRKGTLLKRPRTEGLPDPHDQASEATAQVFQAANDQIDQHAE